MHIMNVVHAVGHLHNDISLDNVMLHFSVDDTRVYIGVCDWGMSTVATQPMKSLYTFTSPNSMTETLRSRWWVDPSIAYLHKANADVEIIPYLSRESEEYAVAKIAMKINRQCMSEEYYRLYRESVGPNGFTHDVLRNVFHQYLERLVKKSEDHRSGLAHIINQFGANYKWPVPSEHFRSSY